MSLNIKSIDDVLPPDDDTRNTARGLVTALLRALPRPGREFAAPARCAWLIGAAALFDFLYGFDPRSPIKIVIDEISRDQEPRH